MKELLIRWDSYPSCMDGRIGIDSLFTLGISRKQQNNSPYARWKGVAHSQGDLWLNSTAFQLSQHAYQLSWTPKNNSLTLSHGQWFHWTGTIRRMTMGMAVIQTHWALFPGKILMIKPPTSSLVNPFSLSAQLFCFQSGAASIRMVQATNRKCCEDRERPLWA